MVEALQVPLENNFENLTEYKLKKIEPDLQINNLAMSGHGPLRQLITVRKLWIPLKPDLVLKFISIQDFINDEMLNDNFKSWLQI